MDQAFRWEGEHLAVDLPGARALFTTRRGGVSSGPYASLNLGQWTDDDPAAVEQNRAALERRLGVRFAYGRQVHGAEVRWAPGPPEGEPEAADGQLTAVPGVAPMVLTADCLPVALAAPGAVGMLHAGWRGLAAGILGRGVRALREVSADGPVVAAIGPGAGPCCYEVSEEVHAEFAARQADLRRGQNLDLPAIAAVQLQRAGVETVHVCGLCTVCSELFFSHRRDAGVTGRQAGMTWLSS